MTESIIYLIKKGDIKELDEFLKTNKSFFNNNYDDTYNVIRHCVENNLISILRLLSDHGLVIEDHYCPDKDSILTFVNSLDMMVFLIDNDVTLNTLNKHIKRKGYIINTLLRLEKDLFLLFIKLGLDLNNKNIKINGMNDLNLLFKSKPNIETLKAWITGRQDAIILEAIVRKYPELCSLTYEEGKTILEHAICAETNISFITFLFDNGMDINYIDITGRSPVLYAAAYRRPDIIKLLYKRGADINHKDRHGRNALIYTKASVVIELLLDLGIETEGIYCGGPIGCICNTLDIFTKIRLFDICVTNELEKEYTVDQALEYKNTKPLYNLIKDHDIYKYIDTEDKKLFLSEKLKSDKELCSLFKEKCKDRKLLALI